MNWLTDPSIWLSLITLTILEIVLGIDNIVFLSIVTDKSPKNQQKKARQIGLSLAMITRILLLLSITILMKLTSTLFNPSVILYITDPLWINNLAISGRDLILMIGGVFLLYKSIKEINEKFKNDEHISTSRKTMSFAATIIQILLLDLVFSLDSVITAVGMAKYVGVMISAVVIAIGIMLLASEKISAFVNKHASVKMLALAFLMLIGISLIAESLDQPIPKGYIYFGMAFAIIVEMLNLREKRKKEN